MSNTCNGATVARSASSYFERNQMFSIIVLLGGTAAAALIGSIVVTARDGYRRQPRETFARTV